MTVLEQYHASSSWQLAQEWLKTWYIAESMVQYASNWSCQFHEGERGAGEFTFEFRVCDPAGMARKLVEFGLVFDENNLEPGALIYDAAEEWLENRPSSAARFPELEACYRGDLAVARKSSSGLDDAE
jgi:hypothetical protein